MGKIRKAWAVMGREGYGDIPLIIIGFFDACIRMAFFSKAAPKFFHDREDGSFNFLSIFILFFLFFTPYVVPFDRTAS